LNINIIKKPLFAPKSGWENYKYQGQELQETGFYSFKWRNYMPDVGRFFNIDPLSEKYAYQSHYNFSENNVTSHRELEGLEAVSADNFNKNQSTLVVLGLGRADGRSGDSVGSGTNTLYSNLPKNLHTDGALASLQNSLGSNIAVAAYTGTDSGLASTHMVGTIANYRSVNPDGNIIMIGHSLGGKDILNAANATTENINLVLTMEPVSVNAGGGTAYGSDPYSASLGGNVQNIISLSADKNMFTGGGGSKTVSGQNSIKATMTGTSQVNIDDSMTPYLKPLIQRTGQGVNPVKWFQNVNWNNFTFQPNVRTGNEEKKGTGTR
jgi:RHS repeat-associated protein